MVNVAVVVLDTLRFDYFKKHFGWLQGLRFSEAYSPSHWTIPVHASILTGKYASEIGVHSKSITLDCKEPTIPECLADQNITSRLFTSNLQIYRWSGWDRGWSETVGPIQLSNNMQNIFDWHSFHQEQDEDLTGIKKYQKAVVECAKSDAPTLQSLLHGFKMKIAKEGGTNNSGDAEAVLNRIENTEFGSDEFLMVNLMEAHAPYYPPEEYRTVDAPVDIKTGDSWDNEEIDKQRVKTAYDDAVHYLSDIYKDIFSQLESDFDYIITLSDHGELLGEHGLWAHSYGLYPELTHVPLVISGDEVENKEIKQPVNLLDVHKTVCELFGIDTDSRGMDLLSNSVPSAKPTNRLTEYHGFLPWVQDQFERRGINPNIYKEHDKNLRGIITDKGNYAYETHDRGLQCDDAVDEMLVIDNLKNLKTSINTRDVQESDLDIDDEVKSQLRDLGYA